MIRLNLYMSKRKIFLNGAAAFLTGIVLGVILWNLGGVPSPSGPGGPFTVHYVGEGIGRGTFVANLPELRIKVNVPQYRLPVDLTKVEGYAELKEQFRITPEQEALLSKNGFVVLRVSSFENLAEAYRYLVDKGLPLLITTDAVLHAYHVLFDETLKRAELNVLIGEMNETIRTLLSKAQTEAQTYAGTPLEHPARLNLMYLEVAYSLISQAFSPTNPQALLELQLISEHKGFNYSPIFGYIEDYSQYVPRGHYTENERLKAYFKTMMWLGRMRFSLLSDGQIDVNQTRAAVLLAWMIKDTGTYDEWSRVYAVTRFFVGVSDDLTPEDYLTVLEESSISASGQLYNVATVAEIAKKLLQRNRAKILGTYAETYPWMPQKGELERILNETAGLRFMGQRFIPDSYMFQQLVYPKVGNLVKPRFFPKGLDVPAVLGSETAEEILNQTEAVYVNYTVQLHNLRKEFQTLDVANWTRNLYWGWLYTLNTTLKPVSGGYSTFMTTKAWSHEKLQTFAGSWTELRHDTILYAKQSYTPKIVSVPPSNTAYVEPYPQTYLRLMGLINMTLNGLNGLNIISEDIEGSLTTFRDNLKLFLDASVLELEGKSLPLDMQKKIRRAAEEFGIILGVASEKTQKVTIVADVHTDSNSQQVLEEALGKFNVLLVVYSNAEGKLHASAGPAYNYFEFFQAMSNRLTDEGWIALLSTRDAPKPPEWTNHFAA